MKRALMALSLVLFLPGCPELALDLFDPFPEAMVWTIHIKKGGAGTARMDLLNITISKKGEEGKRVLSEYIEGYKADPLGVFEGLTDMKHDIGYDPEGKLNAYEEGSFPNIFAIVSLWDSPESYQLRTGDSFYLEWDGDVLAVRLGPKEEEVPEKEETTPKDEGSDFFKLVFTTEGKFLSAAHGEISLDRRKLVIPLSDDDDDFAIEFSIGGLAIEEDSGPSSEPDD